MNIFLKNCLKYLLCLISITLIYSCSDSGISEPYWNRRTYNISKAESDGNTWSRLFTLPLVKDRHYSNFNDMYCDSYGNIYTATTWGGIYKYNRANGAIDSLISFNTEQFDLGNWPTFWSVLSFKNSLLYCSLNQESKLEIVLNNIGKNTKNIIDQMLYSGKFKLSPSGAIYLHSEKYLFVSNDYGLSWKSIETELNRNNGTIYNITFDKYANVFLATSKGVYYSLAGKNNFTCIGLSNTPVSNVQFNSKDWLYALNSTQLFVSKDRGTSWTLLENFPNIGGYSLYINKYNVLFVGTSDGIFRSTDYGETWEYVGLRNTSVEKFTEGINGELLALTSRSGIYVSKK